MASLDFWRGATMAGAIALTSACAELPPVRPIPDSLRQSVTAISAEVSGVKDSNTSYIGARGGAEGSQRGAAQGMRAMRGTFLGLILSPVGAAVGGAKGASDAQSEEVVDETRENLRVAMQETDFGERLRSRLLSADAKVVAATTGSGSAPLQSPAGKPVDQVLALKYRIAIAHRRHVNPQIGIVVTVSAQVSPPDRKTLIHEATWIYCSARVDFVRMAANNAAALRSEIDTAATILAESIPYDLYVSSQPRPLKRCMDFNNLPSGRGQPAPPPLIY